MAKPLLKSFPLHPLALSGTHGFTLGERGDRADWLLSEAMLFPKSLSSFSHTTQEINNPSHSHEKNPHLFLSHLMIDAAVSLGKLSAINIPLTVDKLVNNEHLSENVNMCSLLSERQVSEPELGESVKMLRRLTC